MAVYCYSRRLENKNSHWLAAGFLAAATLLFKYTALPILALVFIAWLIELWRQGASAGSMFRSVACAIAGGIVALALGLAYFLAHDGGKAFWECTVAFNRYYAAASVIFSPAFFWSRFTDFWDNWWILFLMPWAALLQPRPRLWFWLGMFICALAASNESCYGQYYIPMMPFWALLNAVGIRALASRLSRWMPKLVPWAGGLITIVVMLLVIRPDVPWMLCSSEQFDQQKMGGFPFIEARITADRLARMSSPSDFVFVAGSEPEILSYAQRFSPTRFITSYPLMDPTPLAPDYQREAIHDLSQNAPKFIVFVQWANGWTRQATTPPQFINFIGLLSGYKLAGGYVKTSPQTGYWTTNLSVGEYKSSSLLLYQRKSGG